MLKNLRLQQAATNPADRLMDLAIIGVPDAYQARVPSTPGYPKKFSPDCLGIWTKLVSSEEFKAWAKSLDDLDVVWTETIKKFLKECENQGILPFLNNTDLTRNEYIQDAFAKARIQFVQFVDEIKLFEKVSVRKASREYVRSERGLIIRSWAELFNVKYPNFESWLQTVPMPRFIKEADNRYTKMVQANVFVWVRWLNSNRCVVGYEVKLAGTVNIPGKKTPSKKDVAKYIDSVIYLPTIRAHRIRAVKNRLF